MVQPASGISRRRQAARDDANPMYLQRRGEILQAAARVFKAKGLQGSNLGDIAAESGADRASLYYYVGSKEELFHELVRGAVEANLARARDIQQGAGTAPDKLRELLDALMVSYAVHYPILYVFIQENLSHVPDKHADWARDMRRINKDYEQIVVDLVTEGMAVGTIRRTGEPWVVAYSLLGMIGWTSRWYNPETCTASPQEIAATFADTLLIGLERTLPRARRTA